MQIRNRNRRTYLIIRPPGRKNRKRTRERNLSRERKTRRRRYHILFGDSHLKIAIGIFFAERNTHRRFSEIGFKSYNAIVFIAQSDESIAVGFPQTFDFHFEASFFIISTQFSASLYSFSSRAALWNCALPSAKGKPLPFTVFATITVGTPFTESASSTASSI